jgi:hypothetical protein
MKPSAIRIERMLEKLEVGVRYIEVTPESGTEDMAQEISRIARAERLKPNTSLRMATRKRC